MLCGASVALPHAHYESPYTRRGTAIHDFLEAVSKVGREDALKQVDEEWRDVCDQLNLDGLDAALNLAAEVSYAYDYERDTARELGRGQGRMYDDVGPTEIPCTLDVVGVRELPRIRRGKYVEYKSGYSTRRPIALVAQIDFGGLCVARAYGCDVIEGELIHVHEDVAPWVQRRVIEGWEIDAFAAELREHAREWRALRDRFLAGEMPTSFNTGEWCDRCPAREFCPAQTTLVRAALRARDDFDGPLRVQLDALDDRALGRLWDQIHDAEDVLKVLKGRLRGIASSRRINLGKTPEGFDRWLGTRITEGNEKLDGEFVFDAISSLPPAIWRKPGVDEEPITSESVATKATKVTATKKDLDAAIKDAVPRGKKAGVVRDILAKLETIPGAITTKPSVRVVEFTTPPVLEDKLRETLDVLNSGAGMGEFLGDEASREATSGSYGLTSGEALGALPFHDGHAVSGQDAGELSRDDIEALEVLDRRLPQRDADDPVA